MTSQLQKKKIKLTSSNYHSNEADIEYFSVSQFKSFVECEAKTMAKLNGVYTESPSTALFVGSYIHAAFESEEAFQSFT